MADSAPPIPPAPGEGGPRRRALPLALRLLLYAGGAIVLLFVALLLVLQNPAIGTRLTQIGLRGTTPLPRATLTVREVRGNWLTRLEFIGVRFARGDTLLVAIDTLRVHHDPRAMVGGGIDLQRVELRGVTATADLIDTTGRVATPERLSLGDALRARFYTGPEIRVRALSLERGRWLPGAGAPDSVRGFDDVALALSDGRIGGERMAFRLDRVRVERAAPDAFTLEGTGSLRDGRVDLTQLALSTGASRLTGRGAVVTGAERGAGLTRLELNAEGAPLALADVRRLAPGLDLAGDVTAQIALHGAQIDSLDGTVAAIAARLRVGAHTLGATQLAARFERGRAEVVAGSVYEGASLDVTGWARPFDARPTYDLTAIADRLPRRIGGVSAWDAYARRADFATTLRVRGEGYAPARLELEGRARGSAGTIELTGTLATGDSLGWAVQRLVFDDLDVARLAGQAEPSAVSGTFTGRGDGQGLRGELVVIDATYDTWHLERATATVQRGSDGRLRVSDGRFQHLTRAPPGDQPAATTDLSGTFRAEGRGTNLDAWFALEPSLLRGEHVESAEATVAFAGTELRVDGRAASTAGRIELTAQARLSETPVPYTIERLRFEDLDVSAFGGADLPETDLTGTLAAAGDGAGLASGALTLERSRVDRFTLDGAEGRFDFAGGRMRVDADVHTPGGTASLEVAGDTASYDATGTIPFGVLAHALGRDSLASEGALRFTARGHGLTPRTARLDAQATGEGRIGDASVDSVALVLRLAEGIATVDTLLLYSNVAEAHGVGKVALFDTTAVIDSTEGLRFAIATREVEPLEAILGVDTLGVANLLLEGRLYGPATGLAFDASGTVHSLAMDDLRVVGADFLVAGTLDRARRVETGQAHLDLRNVQAAGVRLQSGKLDVTLVEGAPTFELTSQLDATHRVAIAGSARIDSATVHVTLSKADVEADSASWALARPARFTLSRDRFVVDDLEARSTQDGLVRAQGVIDRRGRQDFDVELRALGLDVLSAWMGRTNLGGRIDGKLALDGPAEAPRAKGDVTMSLRSDGQAAGTLAANVEWDGRRLELDGAFTPATGAPLTIAGHLPLALSLAAPAPGESTQVVRAFQGDVDLRVRGEQVALASFAPFFDPAQVTALGGTLDVDVRLSGHSEALAGSGTLSITDGRATLPLLGVTYEQAAVAAGLEGNRVLVREARLRSGKGTLTANGELKIESLTRIEPDLRLMAKDFNAIENKLAHVVASGDVTVTGALDAPIVRGKASVENSEFQITRTTAVNTSAERDVKLTPADIHMMEATFGPVTARKPDLTWLLYDASDLDIEVELRRNTWVRQRSAPRLALELSGNVTVKKRPHEEPELYGRIAPVPGHGYVEQFARRFDFSGGEILLNGPMKSHHVDIQTTFKTASSGDSGGDDVVVRMDVTGQVDDLKLTLSSEPAMSPTEIVSYIATGQTRSEMAADPGTSTSAGSLAAQTALAQVTGRVEDIAQESIGLDVVQIRQDAVQGATLVAGRYVSSRLYVGFRQPVQYQANDNTSTSTNYRTQVEVEYEAYQWLLMNLQGESSEINSFIRARRAY